MKRLIACILTVGIMLLLCACGDIGIDTSGGIDNDIVERTGGADGIITGIPDDEDAGGLHEASEENGAGQSGNELSMLCTENRQWCYTPNGYYYLTEDVEKLSSGEYASHLMYMDYAAMQEIILCSNAGCMHNSPDCPAVFLSKDFNSVSTLLFIHGDYLYFLSKESDVDGSYIVDMSVFGDDYDTEVESVPTVLYRMNLDGRSRKKIYTFDKDVTLEDCVVGDRNGIYLVTKKLVTRMDDSGMGRYMNSSERKLVYLDLISLEERDVYSLDFQDHISWKIIGCYGQRLVLSGVDYGREVSAQEIFDEDTYRNLYDISEDVYITLDVGNGEIKELYRIDNKELHSVIIDGSMLYLSVASTGKIQGIDLISGTECAICTIRQNYLWMAMDDMLCCGSWDDSDQTFYYINVNTGEVSHSELVNHCNGWPLELRAVLDSEVLVIYDYDAVQMDVDTYEILRYQYGLISKKDLYDGVDHFRAISMIGKGV